MLSLCLYALLVFTGFFTNSPLLLLTSVADYFLIFTDWYLPGILIFILVQLGYRRLLGAGVLPLLFLLCPVFFFCRLFFPAADLLVVLAFCYGVCLLANLICSLRRRRYDYFGFFLLLLVCDLHVGLANLSAYYTLPQGMLSSYQQTVPPWIFWIFYLPSQLILAHMLLSEDPRRNLARISSSP